MHHESVNSSQLRSVGYDPITKTMQIRFSQGATYSYHPIEPDEHKALMSAASPGTHFTKHIKSNKGIRCIKL